MINGELLFESMQGIDEEILERSERKKRRWKPMIGLAACFGVLLAAAVALPGPIPSEPLTPPDAGGAVYSDVPGGGQTEPPQAPVETQPEDPVKAGPDEGPEAPPTEWDAIHYNVLSAEMVPDAARVLPSAGYFTEALNRAEIEAVVPSKRYEWTSYSGVAGFDGEGKLLEVWLEAATSLPGKTVGIVLSDAPIFVCAIPPEEPVVSRCGDVAYRIYQYERHDGGTALAAESELDGVYFRFTMDAAPEELAGAKADFEDILYLFTYFSEADEGPVLSAVTAGEIPEWFDYRLTLSEAREDPKFGALMLPGVPSGFAEESIRRYKNQNYDYLSGLWTRGYDSLSWRVSRFGETDAARLTGVDARENYDLSLYPIPRAESVPRHLWEIVNNPIFDIGELTLDAVYARSYRIHDAGDADGWRMDFSVRYGDYVVEIDAKGVSPEWVYEQLKSLDV